MKPQKIIDLEKKLEIELKDSTKLLLQGSINNSFVVDKKGDVLQLNLNNILTSDISFLEDFVKLNYLELDSSFILDISPLKELINLKTLKLSLKARSVLIENIGTNDLLKYDDYIFDISILKNLLNLTSLELNLEINTDLSILKDLPLLKELNLNITKISDISVLEKLNQLYSLSIKGKSYTDYSFLKNLTNLRILCLYGNNIKKISFLENLINLIELNLSYNDISDISFLQDLTQLTFLDISDNKIKDISFLENLIQLNKLYLNNNQIKDIPHLENLKKISVLDLANNEITNISALEKLNKLFHLNLGFNQISDISALKNLINLNSLYISNNNISDISGLENLTKLTKLEVMYNQIFDMIQFEFIKKLPKLHIKVKNNPCIINSSIVLEERGNDYDVIVNELLKIEEANFAATSIKGYLPEKIVVLGNHSSGKTSLLHYLQNKNLNYTHASTHILQINEYSIDDENVLPDAIIYDFGGQDFYHGIYQTFLTSGAITLLVWHSITNSNSKGIDFDKLPICNYNVNYWLGQWEQKIKPSELLLIQTHRDIENNKRQSYININTSITEEFYISLEKENLNTPQKKTKYSALNYLQESINELVINKRIENNPKGRISKPYYEFIVKLIEKSKTQKAKPIKKSELRGLYKINEDKRFEIELDQLRLKGMLMIYKDNIWLNPVNLTKHVHDKLSKEKVGKGILDENDIKNLGLTRDVLDLLINQKVIFKHEYGLNENREQQVEYIIPNYLPLVESSDVDYDLMIFGLDNPLFCMKFENFIPFGLINQIICYFGKLPDSKKFWRDQLVFTISDESIKICKVLIRLDMSNLKINVFAVFTPKSEFYKNEIIEYLYYVFLSFYHDYTLNIVDDFSTYKKNKEIINENTFRKIDENSGEKSNIFKNLEDKSLVKYLYTSRDSRFMGIFSDIFPSRKNYDFQINDLYLSIDNEIYIKQEELLALGEEPIIKTYNSNLEIGREKPAIDFQNFTPYKIKTMKKIFISYSKDDLTLVNQFMDHLSSLKRDKLIGSWYCTELIAGGEWDKDIQRHFDESDIICIMVSSNLMKTDYIHKYEIAKAFEKKRNKQDFKIVPIILNYCRWSTKENDLSQFTALPYTAKPITDFNDKNMAWFIVVECLRIMIEKEQQPEGDDWYNNESLPKSIRNIYQRIVNGLIDNNTFIKRE